MKSVTIPVSPFSRKLLQARYCAEKIIPARKDLLFHYLHYKNLQHKNQLEKLNNILTDVIEIEVPDKLAKHLEMHGYQVGFHLYNIHISEMCQYALAQNQAGVPAYSAIKRYLEDHFIWDDDFCLDAAYKRYQRFIWRFDAKYQKKSNPNRQEFSNQNKRLIPLRGERLRSALAKLMIAHIHFFRNKSGQVNNSFILKASIYNLIENAQFTVRDIAKANGLAEKTVYHHWLDFRRNYLKS